MSFIAIDLNGVVVDARSIPADEHTRDTYICATPGCNGEMKYCPEDNGCSSYFSAYNVFGHKDYCAEPLLGEPVDPEKMKEVKFPFILYDLGVETKFKKSCCVKTPPLEDIYTGLKQRPITEIVQNEHAVSDFLLDMRCVDNFMKHEEFNPVFLVEAQLDSVFYKRSRRPTKEKKFEIMKDTTRRLKLEYEAALFLHVGAQKLTLYFEHDREYVFRSVLKELFEKSEGSATAERRRRVFVVACGFWKRNDQNILETHIRSNDQILVLK